MDHTQRANAVGANPSYLPSGDPGRDGGGTYTGQATEPTIQDYENFFGPSARDIKHDLQRFKRHGRWHLPDVLQGPNPWLTDRIDGLITDATNSPFTTKILPYRYKEDVDGKIKWNVWSFDEGMASRVPYESAARTLTQSKRSFAGYMVRQGMAIVLEHNFMMTPKGRENFKNQLNQLIGSIQYTNDFDVHMALVLAPSYQKTLQERYYTTDKSPSQLCREYADLFGMMQKNVNALDILIEEGKAILRTWGGPMPDFLLCNSKLTFQMTMTPEKTNYITQGIDGVKRLRQGPDLGNYRGLSIIHSRSFSLETGQHPRDVLRRRVRTAEYYRIPPSAKNVNREFEFYNEERDTWFTLTFADLLRCARYSADTGDDNSYKLEQVCHFLAQHERRPDAMRHVGGLLALGDGPRPILGAYTMADSDDPARLQTMLTFLTNALTTRHDLPAIQMKTAVASVDIRNRKKHYWYLPGASSSLGVRYLPPRDNQVWDESQRIIKTGGPEAPYQRAILLGPLTHKMCARLYVACSQKPLNDLLGINNNRVIKPRTPEWNSTYLFILECIKRQGLSSSMLRYDGGDELIHLFVKPDAVDRGVDVKNHLLTLLGARGSVNHPYFLPRTADSMPGVADGLLRQIQALQHDNTRGHALAQSLLLTYEILVWLLSPVEGPHQLLIHQLCDEVPDNIATAYNTFQGLAPTTLTGQTTRFCNSFVDADTRRRAEPDELLRLGLTTIPSYLTSSSHLYNERIWPDPSVYRRFVEASRSTYGHLNNKMCRTIGATVGTTRHPWSEINIDRYPWPGPAGDVREDCRNFFVTLRNRLFGEPMAPFQQFLADNDLGVNVLGTRRYDQESWRAIAGETTHRALAPGNLELVIDLNQFFVEDDEDLDQGRYPSPGHVGAGLELASNVEVVIVRPNIEHNMLGIIMGLGGEELGNTLWGQTELSVYDDSMHGIWGMSYKYHERAIVFNEKNLVRMWDIAYDGYNGGKDDTWVNWTNFRSVDAFKEATLNLGKNYRGPSMMVMAFVHDRGDDAVFGEHFQRNWPSPIVYYDSFNPQARGGAETIPVDFDNLQAVNVEEFRVFNNDLYFPKYRHYREMMPDFRTLHMTRKSAGQSSADSETGVDVLAYQGSMRIKERGALVQEIQGSGHHGPDYTGVASVRAGKGQKVAGQAPTLHRLI